MNRVEAHNIGQDFDDDLSDRGPQELIALAETPETGIEDIFRAKSMAVEQLTVAFLLGRPAEAQAYVDANHSIMAIISNKLNDLA
ncbi:MAG: hypothetical protein WDN27_02500 [Candidatus Saccharibacteria bacterium]